MSARRGTYIAGPMRGHAEFNFPAFFAAERWALDWFGSWPILNPAARDVAEGFDPTGLAGTNEELADLNFDLPAAMRHDLNFIVNEAARVAMLPGWSTSSGATLERSVAIACGVAVIYLASPSGPPQRDPLPADRSENP